MRNVACMNEWVVQSGSSCTFPIEQHLHWSKRESKRERERETKSALAAGKQLRTAAAPHLHPVNSVRIVERQLAGVVRELAAARTAVLF